MVVKQKAEQSEDDTENKKKITMFINKCKEVYVSYFFFKVIRI